MDTFVNQTDLARKVLLVCGILAALLFVGTDRLAGTLWKGYSFTSQSISELSAVGAPTRPLVLPLQITMDILMIAFGLGLWALAGPMWAPRRMAGLIVGYAVLGLAGAFFPIHLSGAVRAFASTMNVLLTGLSVFSLLLAIASGALAFSNWFRWFSIGTLLVFLVLTILGLFVLPQLTAGEPVSRVGAQERTMMYTCFLWVVMLAVDLLRDL